MTGTGDYDPVRCNLCGSTETSPILFVAGRSMTSDSRIVSESLDKVGCLGCGLVRNGQPVVRGRLDEHYGTEYRLGEQAAAGEPLVFSGGEPRARSEVLADAVERVAGDAGPPRARLLEVGCGEGLLLERLSERWPGAVASGLDLSSRSVELARGRGLDVHVGSYGDVRGTFDLIVTVAVIEHVPSPRDFLARLGGALSDGGMLAVAEPVQGGSSFDLFFSDHLHHFSPHHVAAAAAAEGLEEVASQTLAPAYPDFMLHAFRRGERRPFERAAGAESVLAAVREQARRWQDVFARVETWLAALRSSDVAVWGLGQTYTLFLAYAGLDPERIAVGLDDNPDRFAGTVPFPVRRLEDWLASGERRLPVLLAFAPTEAVLTRLESAEVAFDAPLIRHDR